MKLIKLLAAWACLMLITGLNAQTLKTDGKKIVNDQGQEVLLRGMGLGGWMLMEGYMMQSSDVADTQHEFRERLVDLIGTQKTDEFFDVWLANHVTKKDIDSLAKWGYNSVRLPMHYNLFTLPIEEEPVAGQNTWLDKGFTMVDELLGWCEANQMYLILDLHAAPGGQGANAAISDYDPDKPSLWESEENKAKTVALWKKLAERYKDEPWIGGYDLINETNWNLPGGTALKNLYQDITTAIRSVDQKHIIFIEGNWFANDFTGLTPPWDDNMAYSFHKYWSYNDQASIQWVLDIREEHNVPLWMGEAGENSNVWFTDAISLFERNGIGWSWWPMKRVETIVAPYAIKFTQGYRNILEYWRGNASRPSEAQAYEWLMELANNTNSANCLYQKDVADAKIRQVATETTKPYAHHEIPGVVFMSDYDMGRNKIAYFDIDEANYSLSTNQFQAWNSGWVYRNDGVDLEANNDQVNSNGFHVGWTNKGEWINYTVNITETATYKMEARIAGVYEGGQYHLALDGESVTTTQSTRATGEWTSFETHTVEDIVLPQGTHVLTLHIDGETSFNISSLQFTKTGAANAVGFKILTGNTLPDELSIGLTVNKEVNESSIAGSLGDFSVTVNGTPREIASISKGAGNRGLEITLKEGLVKGDLILLSYQGSTLTSTLGDNLEAFSDLEIANQLPARFTIPGKIEAEDYAEMFGLQTESTTDTGGGLNIGYTHVGDYADYFIEVADAGNYEISLRVAAESQSGAVGFFVVKADGSETKLNEIALPVTNGWQNWETVKSSLDLPEGKITLRMKVLKEGFNMNWMQIDFGDSDQDGVADVFDLCPDTPEGSSVNVDGCVVFSLPPDNFLLRLLGETCRANDNGSIQVTAKATFNYTAILTGQGVDQSQEFTAETTFSSLKAGEYSLCLKLQEQPDYERCFWVNIEEPEDLSVISMVNPDNSTVSLQLNGADHYTIRLNGVDYPTSASSITLPLNGAKNDLRVKTDKDCQGVYQEFIDLNLMPRLFPNPITGSNLYVESSPYDSSETELLLFDLTGRLLMRKNMGKRQLMEVDVEALPKGIYLVHLFKGKEKYNYKIVK